MVCMLTYNVLVVGSSSAAVQCDIEGLPRAATVGEAAHMGFA